MAGSHKMHLRNGREWHRHYNVLHTHIQTGRSTMFTRLVKPDEPEDPYNRYGLLVAFVRKHELNGKILPEEALRILTGNERVERVYYEYLQHSLSILGESIDPVSRTDITLAAERIKERLGENYPELLERFQSDERRHMPKSPAP